MPLNFRNMMLPAFVLLGCAPLYVLSHSIEMQIRADGAQTVCVSKSTEQQSCSEEVSFSQSRYAFARIGPFWKGFAQISFRYSIEQEPVTASCTIPLTRRTCNVEVYLTRDGANCGPCEGSF